MRGAGAPASCEREVAPTFTEVARISTTLAVAPTTFIALTPHRTASMLALGGTERGLALKRHEGRCVFLLELATTSLCGLGDLAPHACKVRPDTPLPAGTRDGSAPRDTKPPFAPDPERQHQLETKWRARLANRHFPLTPEVALDGLLALMADES